MKQRYFLIDGLRTVCALIVVLYHYRDLFLNPVTTSVGLGFDTPRNMAVFRHLNFIFDYGSWAVMLFWSISGFIFAHVYGNRRDISGRAYFMNRFSRLYPLHFVTLLYTGFLHVTAMQVFGHQISNGTNTLATFVLSLLFMGSWGFTDIHSFNVPIWSVSVEIAIYIVFFLVLRFLGVTLLSMAALALACLAMIAVTPNLIPVCGVYFFLSAAAWTVLQQLERMPPRLRWTLVAGLTLLAVLPAGLGNLTARHLPLTVMVAPLCAMGLTLLALVEHRLPQEPVFLGAFGDITYSTYLLHIPMQQSLILAMMCGLVSPSVLIQPLAPLVYLGLVIVAGHLCFRHFEHMAQTWLRRRSLKRA